MKRIFRIVAGLGLLIAQAFLPIVGPGVSDSAEVTCTHNGKSYPPGSEVCINGHRHECGKDGTWFDLKKFC